MKLLIKHNKINIKGTFTNAANYLGERGGGGGGGGGIAAAETSCDTMWFVKVTQEVEFGKIWRMVMEILSSWANTT